MPFKETKEGQTNYCPHTKDGTICGVCLGKEKWWGKEFDKKFKLPNSWQFPQPNGLSKTDELKSFISHVESSTIDKCIEVVKKTIHKHLEYCRQQNGLPYCKNCGLGDSDDIVQSLTNLKQK